MACGEYSYKVDKHGRTTMPPMLRQRTGGRVMLIYYPKHRCIGGYPSRLARQPFDRGTSIEHTAYDISERSIGSRGRITIPAKLREYAEIEVVVVIVAEDDYFELWGEKNWKLEIHQAMGEATDLIAGKCLDIRRCEDASRLSKDLVNKVKNTKNPCNSAIESGGIL